MIDTDFSLQLCPCCGGEGYQECDGTGDALVPVEPIDLEHLFILSGGRT